VTARAVTSRPSNEATIESVLAAYQLQGFIRVGSSSAVAAAAEESVRDSCSTGAAQLSYNVNVSSSSMSWNTVTVGM
jgi:hypothetical protein